MMKVPATRVSVFGAVVCADCGYHDGRHGDDCSYPTREEPDVLEGDKASLLLKAAKENEA